MSRPPQPFLLGVAGDPVDHSLSPAFQNAALSRLGLPFLYRAFRCPDPKSLRKLIESAPSLGLKGLNLTTPLKEAGARLLISAGSADREVRWSRSANTLLLDGPIAGFSTDGRGGRLWLEERGVSSRSRILVLGAGASARSLLWHLWEAGWEGIRLVTRRPEAVRRLFSRSGLAAARAAEVVPPDRLKEGEAGAFDALVSTWPPEAVTPSRTRALASCLAPSAAVFDFNYGRGRDRLHRWASARGYRSADGRGLLLHQGALSFTAWTRRRPPLDVMRRALGLDGPAG